MFDSKILCLIVLLGLLMQSPCSFANCETLLESLVEQLNYPDGIQAEEGNFSACKISPDDKTQTIVAFAIAQKPGLPADSAIFYDLTVLLVANESGKILQRVSQKNAFESNAVALKNIAIDTARYKVAAKLRGFGVRANFASNSHSYSARFETINLYVPDGKVLKPLVTKLIVSDDTGSGDFGRVGPNDACTGKTSEARRTLATGRGTRNGYADIVVTEKTRQSESALFKGKCETDTWRSKKSITLQFDGNAYSVPKGLQYE